MSSTSYTLATIVQPLFEMSATRVTTSTFIALLFCFNFASSQFYERKIGRSINITESYDVTYSTECNAYSYFSVFFIYPCKDLSISLKPTAGQPDIYVSKANRDRDPYPTRGKLTWASYADNIYTLNISRYDPESSPGYYYIGIYNDCSKQNEKAIYQIRARPITLSSTTKDILVNRDLGINQHVTANGYTYFEFCVPICANVRIALDNCLDNEKCPKAYSYPELLVSRDKMYPRVKDYRYLIHSLCG